MLEPTDARGLAEHTQAHSSAHSPKINVSEKCENGSANSANSQKSTHISHHWHHDSSWIHILNSSLRARKERWLYVRAAPLHLQHGMEMHISELPSYLKIDDRASRHQGVHSVKPSLCLKHPKISKNHQKSWWHWNHCNLLQTPGNKHRTHQKMSCGMLLPFGTETVSMHYQFHSFTKNW